MEELIPSPFKSYYLITNKTSIRQHRCSVQHQRLVSLVSTTHKRLTVVGSELTSVSLMSRRQKRL